MLLRYGLLCALAMSVACGNVSFDEPDGSVPDVMVQETRSLELLSDTRLMLSEGAEAEIRIRYSNMRGEGLAGETLSVALDGTANDSSLDDLEVETNASGIATATVIAGAVASTFRVRVSADDAPSVYVNVSVSDSGFGRISVTPLYSGEREGDLGVAVLTGATCDDDRVLEERTRYRAVDDAGVTEFVGLPAGVPLALVGRLDGGELLAAGCVDGIMVDPATPSTSEVTLSDLSLRSAGAYETHLRFDVTALQTPARESILATGVGPASYAAMLLDAIEAMLGEAGALMELAELVAARAGGLDTIYATMIREQAAGFDVALGAMADEVSSALSAVDVVADLRVGEMGEMVTMATRDVIVGEEGLAMATGFNAAIDLRASAAPNGEELAVERLNIHLSAGALAGALARRSATDAGFESVMAWASALARCESLPSPIDSCDEECARNACERSVEVLVEGLADAYLALDESWPDVRMSGTIELEENDGDLTPDEVSASFDAQWGESGPAVPVELDGERILPPE